MGADDVTTGYVLSEDLQRMFDGRLSELEDSMRRLLRELRRALGPEHRDAEKLASDKLDIFLAGIEELIWLRQGETRHLSARDLKIAELHKESDRVLMLRAQIERTKRATRRELEDLALDRRERETEQTLEELEAEFPGR